MPLHTGQESCIEVGFGSGSGDSLDIMEEWRGLLVLGLLKISLVP